jgi:nucleoside-diphosphate-sugar epimerase
MDVQSNRVLVTGGRGFIGRAVVKLLQRSGCGVVSLDAAPGTSSSASRHEVECDLIDVRQLQRVFEIEPVGGIIHLAAILPTAVQRQPARATEVNVEGSLHLLAMARRFGVRRFVFGSSLSIYGTCPEDHVVSEADRAAPEDLYGAAKLYVEQLGAAYRQYGLEFVSLRIGRVVGSGARSASSAWRSQIFECLASEHAAQIALPYVGSERILLVHVDDVAKMLVGLLQAERPAHTVYNAGCESVVVADLKREVESLNSNIRVRLGEAYASGNPRLLDWSRFREEFGFQTLPIFEQLQRAAEK